MLKITKLLFFASLLIFMSACGNDDEPENVTLEGTWKVKSLIADTKTTSEGAGISISSEALIEGQNMNYEVTFEETTWTTSGDYSLSYDFKVDGMEVPLDDVTLSDVSGNGSYSTDGNIMTISGAFFEFEIQGMDFSELNSEQMTEYEINSNGELVFSQNEVITNSDSGITTITTVVSESVWEKQ